MQLTLNSFLSIQTDFSISLKLLSEIQTDFLYIINHYQLDFVTPGNFPADARFLKQILQIPAFLINALGLPHIGQRL